MSFLVRKVRKVVTEEQQVEVPPATVENLKAAVTLLTGLWAVAEKPRLNAEGEALRKERRFSELTEDHILKDRETGEMLTWGEQHLSTPEYWTSPEERAALKTLGLPERQLGRGGELTNSEIDDSVTQAIRLTAAMAGVDKPVGDVQTFVETVYKKVANFEATGRASASNAVKAARAAKRIISTADFSEEG